MRHTYSFVVFVLLGKLFAIPLDINSGVGRALDARAPPPLPPKAGPNTPPGSPGGPITGATPAPAVGQPPQLDSPTPGSSKPQKPAIGSGSSGMPKTNSNALPQGATRQVPSGLDFVGDRMEIPSSLLPPPDSCPGQSPNGRESPNSGVRPLNPGIRTPNSGIQPPNSGPNSQDPPKRPGTPGKRGAVVPPKRVFVGYRGTNSDIADAYKRYGLAGGPQSGNGQRLGDGIYVTDDITIAADYARRTAKTANEDNSAQPGGARWNVYPTICTIFAEDERMFRGSLAKVFLPPSAWAQEVNGLPHSSPESLTFQETWIRDNVDELRKVPTSSIIKFTNMNWQCPENFQAGNQMMIPRSLLSLFSVQGCIEYEKDVPSMASPTLRNPNNKLDYRKNYSTWNIWGRHFDYQQTRPTRI